MAKKAIIRTESYKGMSKRARAIARRVDSGKRGSEADYRLNFKTAAQLFAELTAARLALLETLKQTGAQSIYALAKRLERNYSNVHRDVSKLIELELIGRDNAGLIFVPWEEIVIRAAIRKAA